MHLREVFVVVVVYVMEMTSVVEVALVAVGLVFNVATGDVVAK